MDQEAGALIGYFLKRRRALQMAVAIAGLVPVTAGMAGTFDPTLLDLAGRPQALSHAAYLSGLLLGIGLGFWSTIPAIETKGGRFSLLAAIVVLGGLARLFTAVRLGVWSPSVAWPLAMELGVTPALWLWQRRLSSGV
jgi:hypothetical protein